jgi:MYXO-CTERM domain-containing protein
VTLNGANQEVAQVSGPFPALPPGTYYAIAVIDPGNQIAETNEANNSVVSATPFTSGPDFGVGSVTIPMAVAPGAAAPITTTLTSLSVAYDGQVSYRLWASADQTVDPMDTVLGTYTVTFASQASLPDVQMVTFAASIPVSAYYVIARVDHVMAITEVNENNNTTVSATTIINGPDFAVTGPSFSPATVEGGQTVMVSGTLTSVGLQFIGNLEYGVFVSADATFDPGDLSIYSGSVAFGGQASMPVSASFPLPNVAPGGYTVFLVADPDNLEAEAIETNNALAAAGTMTVQGADLRVVSIAGEPAAFIGRTYRVELTVGNTGIANANGFQYAYFLSEDESIRIFDTQIFVSQTATIASGGQMSFVDTVTIPTLTATASLYLGVIVDIFDRVPETNTPNNIARIPEPIRVVFPIPDLQAQIVETATSGAAGEQFAITRQILNRGVADASMFDYRYYLSTNPIISTDDREIGSGVLTLGEGEDDYAIDVLILPSDIPEGTYYVGLIVDPGEVIEEVSDDNNTGLGPQIPIFRAAIQFVTDRLPNATTGVRYEVGVYARGGPLPITWSAIAGTLPLGLSLDAASGIISGVPIAEGLSEFTLRASSSTAYADKDYEIRVSAPTVELEIATPSLPTGIKGRPYEATLIAVGGDPPYVWEAISELPGLMLAQDGTLTGIPTTPGNLPITVSVRDAVNNSDSKALVLSVINANQAVQITQVPLPKAVVGLPYCEPESITLEAQNGVPPYSWSLIGSAPPGLTFSMAGELCGVPEQAGSFPITVRAQDATGLFDTALFLLEVSGGTELAISSFSLPDGQVGQPYSQSLTAVRGMEPYAWRLVDGAGVPPPGLTIAEDGAVSGTPTADGVFAFVVQVIDGQRRTDTQPLSIVVAPAPVVVPPDDGCGCASTGSSRMPAALLLLGLLFFRRRR